MPSVRTTIAVLSSTALLGAVAGPALAQDGSGTYPSDSTTQAAKKGKRGGKLTDAQLTTVATKLGTTLEALKAAQAKVKAAVKATEARETKAEQDALLAEELGVTVSELRAAFASVRPARGERRGDGRLCDKPASGSADGTSGSYPSDSAGSYPTAL